MPWVMEARTQLRTSPTSSDEGHICSCCPVDDVSDEGSTDVSAPGGGDDTGGSQYAGAVATTPPPAV